MPDPGIDLRVGYVAFGQRGLAGVRNGDGVRITIPTTIGVRWAGYPAPRPMFSGIRCNVRMESPTTGAMDLGQALDVGFYLPPQGGIDDLAGSLQWQVTFATLALIERARNGQAPRFQFDVVGLVTEFHCVHDASGQSRDVASPPSWVAGNIRVSYAADAWVAMRRGAGVSQHVLLDIPFPDTAPAGWEGVWKHIMDAVTSFEQGGHVAWKNCVTSVREALTEWAKLDRPDLSQTNATARTVDQRVDHLRDALRNLAHLGPHGHAENWTRDDAVLALATLSALLARRKP